MSGNIWAQTSTEDADGTDKVELRGLGDKNSADAEAEGCGGC